MINTIYFFALFTMGLFDSPETKLITVYDKDCGYCHDLLNDTYKNRDVEDALDNFDHQLFEADEEETKALMKEYGIVGFPTQILITKQKDTLFLEGFVNAKQQMSFLAFGGTEVIGGEAVKSLSEVANQMGDSPVNQDSELSEIGKKIICIFVKNESFEDFMTKTEKRLQKEGVKYKNIHKYISDVSNDIICENKLSIHMRKKTSLFKHALDTLNYKFITGSYRS